MGSISIRLFIRSLPPLGHPAGFEAQPARPKAQPPRPKAQPAKPQALPSPMKIKEKVEQGKGPFDAFGLLIFIFLTFSDIFRHSVTILYPPIRAEMYRTVSYRKTDTAVSKKTIF